MPIRVVLADDHPLVLRGICAVVRGDREYPMVAECSDGQHALDAIHAHQPDVAVLDLHMPGKTGLEVLREMKASAVHTRGVLLVSQIGDEELLEATRQNVAGVVLKEMAPRLLVQCLRKVHAGEPWIERTSAARAFEKLLRRESSTRDLARLLTPREIEIVKMVARGLRNKALAGALVISEGTVKSHLHSVFEKLGVRSRAELIAYCNERGIL